MTSLFRKVFQERRSQTIFRNFPSELYYEKKLLKKLEIDEDWKFLRFSKASDISVSPVCMKNWRN